MVIPLEFGRHGDMVPLRVNFMTFNVWGSTLWSPERRKALQDAVSKADPDVLMLQEITPEILDALDEVLPGHTRVKNAQETAFARVFTKGWSTESQIYFRKSMFDLVESGYEDLELLDHPDRGLFWARFLNEETGVVFIAATCHMPWPGCSEEEATGVNQRVLCAKRVAKKVIALTSGSPDEPFILGGDFNEGFHPQRILRESLQMRDCFEVLDMPPPITHPVRNTDTVEITLPDQSLDLIMFRNCKKCVGAFAKTIRGPIIASDHLPVQAILELS